MNSSARNLLSPLPYDLSEEFFETICQSKHVRIERIVSKGHTTPEGSWYDQDDNEFVVLLQGKAGLSFDGQNEIVTLSRGDYLDIKAHVRHRVEWTSQDEETVWLAVFYS